MGCRIIVGHGQGSDHSDNKCCLYCSTTEWAFGPTFDSEQHAEDFLGWLIKTAPDAPDPRSYTDRDLGHAHLLWWRERGEKLDDILEAELDAQIAEREKGTE